MLARTIDAHEHSVVYRHPLRIWLLAVKTKVIHIPFHFIVFLEIASLVLKPILSHGWTTELGRVLMLRVLRVVRRCWRLLISVAA